MIELDESIQKEIADYTGPHADLIAQAPAMFRLLTGLLEDPNMPGKMRPLVMVAIAYFVLQADIMPEYLQGPHGYADDIFLAAWVADYIRRAMETDSILTENWDGQRPVLPMIEAILSREKELIGDKRELILWYTGFEHLAKDL